MRKETIIFSTFTLVVGSFLGFVAGYKVCERKLSEPEDDDEEDEDEDAEPSKPFFTEKKKEEKQEEKETVPVEEDPLYVDYTKPFKEIDPAEKEHPMDSDEDEDDEEDDNDDLPPCYERPDEPIDDEEVAEYLDSNFGAVKPITAYEYHSENRTVRFKQKELYYFPDEDKLIDWDGFVIEDESEFCGDVLTKLHFKTDKSTETYIRNFPREEDYWVHKELTRTKEEVFGW